jgi:hypothetical protein
LLQILLVISQRLSKGDNLGKPIRRGCLESTCRPIDRSTHSEQTES